MNTKVQKQTYKTKIKLKVKSVVGTLCKIQLIWRYSRPCNVINKYALILAGVKTMLLSLIITSRSVSMKSNTSDTLDLCPNTSERGQRTKYYMQVKQKIQPQYEEMIALFSIILALDTSLHNLQVPSIWLTQFRIYFFLLKETNQSKRQDRLLERTCEESQSSYSSKYNTKKKHRKLMPNTFLCVIVYTHQVNNIRML